MLDRLPRGFDLPEMSCRPSAKLLWPPREDRNAPSPPGPPESPEQRREAPGALKRGSADVCEGLRSKPSLTWVLDGKEFNSLARRPRPGNFR